MGASMSYRFLSTKTGSEHDLDQWDSRTLEGELAAFHGRTLLSAFKKYFTNRKVHAIEAGCGLGAWCEWFQRAGHSIIGIEYDIKIVNQAIQSKSTIPVIHGDITNIQFPENSFDAYISLGVIEHFENGPDEALMEAFRVLKKDGLGFFTTPLLTPLRRLISHPIRSLYFLYRTIMGKPSYFWEYRFTKNELRQYLIDAGFTIIDEGVDDYDSSIPNRHLGLWADWFFLRKSNGEIWELNMCGKILLKCLRIFPSAWYSAGYLFVVKPNK